jgi:hypothetical protein
VGKGRVSVPSKTKQRKVKESKTVTAPSNGGSGNGSGPAVQVATITKAKQDFVDVYDRAVKEIVALGENDQFAKKVDTGPLSEARGKDTWHLHVQLRVLQEVNELFHEHATRLQDSLSTLDEHVATNSGAVAQLVEEYGTASLETIRTLQDSVASVLNKGVEDLYQRLQDDLSAKIEEQQDVFARLVDRRFNQTDIAFASVRADVEVVKSLLTDIIKSRIGRSERNQD